MSELLDKAEFLVAKAIERAGKSLDRGTDISASHIETLARAASTITYARAAEKDDGQEVGGS